jgi:zinc transporter
MTTTLPYASDFSGLVCGFRFTPDAAGIPIDSTGALDWLAQCNTGHDGDDFV